MKTMVKRTCRSVTLQVHCLPCSIPAVNPTHLIVLDLVILIKFITKRPANIDPLHCKFPSAFFLETDSSHVQAESPTSLLLTNAFLRWGDFRPSPTLELKDEIFWAFRSYLFIIFARTLHSLMLFNLFSTHRDAILLQFNTHFAVLPRSFPIKILDMSDHVILQQLIFDQLLKVLTVWQTKGHYIVPNIRRLDMSWIA